MEAVEHHRNHMHNRLLRLVCEHVSVRLNLPDGTKVQRAEHSSIGTYEGSFKFSDLEEWLTNLMVLFKISMYGGEDRDRERVLCTLQFLNSEAKHWFQHHVVSVKREKLSWTFEEVILGLYDRFVHPSTMQDAREDFLHARYKAETGVQGFYDNIMDHAQNMAVHPDEYQIMEVFLKGVPTTIYDKLFENSLLLEVNTIDDLMSCAKAIEMSHKTAEYYRKKPLATSTSAVGMRLTPRTPTTTDKPQQRATSTNCRPQLGFQSRDRDRRQDFPRRPYQPPGEVWGNNPCVQEDSQELQPVKPIVEPRRTPAGDACFNCRVGHYAVDCPRPKQPRD